MLEKLLKLYIESLKIHIGTKTIDNVFHDFTEDVYNELFNVFHTTSEKLEDIGEGRYSIGDLPNSKKRIYDIIEEAKQILEEVKGDYTTGFDNQTRGLIDKLEFLCGNAKSFIEEEKEEDIFNKK